MMPYNKAMTLNNGFPTKEAYHEAAAIDLAQYAHAGQTRKGNGEPYWNHPRRVAKAVLEITHDSDLYCAAMLHDAVEDSNGKVTLEMIAKEISPEVAEIVGTLTHTKGEDYFEYIARVCANPGAAQIKRADVLDNLRDLPFNHKNFKKYVRVLSMLSEIK